MKRLVLILTAALLAASAPAQTLARQGWAGSGIQPTPWYRQAIFYQIDPISFADSNADGFGDLAGITAHLDYVESLNVDAILVSPLALEPTYARDGSGPAFDPIYGTLDDLDQLIAAASSHHLRVLVDLRLDQTNTPAEAATTARFWLAHGVAGLHILNAAPGANTQPDRGNTARLDEVRHVVASAPGQRVLLLEPGAAGPAIARSTGFHHSHHAASPSTPAELTLQPGALMLATLNATTMAAALHLSAAAYPALRTDSPDSPRSFDRHAAGPAGLREPANAARLARSLAMILLTAPAAPVLYFGQELGMRTTPVRAGIPPAGSPRTVEPGDAGEPTPMQWDPSLTAPNGFSAGTPWIALAASTVTANVATEDADPASLLNWYRKLDLLRHTQASLREGTFTLIASGTPGVLAWLRQGAKVGGTASAPVLVLVNLNAKAAIAMPADLLRRAGLTSAHASQIKVLASSEDGLQTTPTGSIALPPFGCYAGELTTQRGLESVATPVRRSRKSGR